MATLGYDQWWNSTSHSPTPGMTSGQQQNQYYQDYLNSINPAAQAAEYQTLSPETLANADPRIQAMRVGSEGMWDQNLYDQILAQRTAEAQTQEGKANLSNEDLAAKQKTSAESTQWWKDNPNGDSTANFMEKIIPLAVGGLVAGGALGLWGTTVGEAGAAASAAGMSVPASIASVGGEIAAQTLPVASLLGDAGGAAALDGLGITAGATGAGSGLGAAAGHAIDPSMYGPINVPTNPSALNAALNSPASGLPGTGAAAAGTQVPYPQSQLPGITPQPLDQGPLNAALASPASGLPSSAGVPYPTDVFNGFAPNIPIDPAPISNALDTPGAFPPLDPITHLPADGSVNNPSPGTPGGVPNGSGSGLSSLLPSGGSDLLNLLKGLNDLYNNRQTADNAQANMDAMKAAAAANQANATKYLGGLNDLASFNQGNNTNYLNKMNGIAQQNQTADSNYVSSINGLADQGRTANAGYISSLNGLYAPGSPEVLAMQRQMDAQDAASGRNSQYGTRAVDLAAKLAPIRANIMENPAYTSAMQNTIPNALQTSSGYLNAMHGTGATDIYNSTGYNAALGNKSVNDILASPAYANTVNNTAMMNTLMSQAYQGANTTGQNASNSQFYSLLSGLGNMFNSQQGH